MNEPDERDAQAVSCPHCEAPAGKPCRNSKTGKRIGRTHPERYVRAREALRQLREGVR